MMRRDLNAAECFAVQNESVHCSGRCLSTMVIGSGGNKKKKHRERERERWQREIIKLDGT